MQSSSGHRSLFGGTAYTFLAEALLLPTGLLTAAFLTRRLGLESYGLFVLTTTLVAWVQWSVVSIFSRSTIKFVGESEDWQPVATVVVRLHFWVATGSALLLWLGAEPVAQFLKEPSLTGYLRLLAFDIPLFSLAYAHRGILTGLGRFKARAAITAGRLLTRLVLIVLLVELGWSVEGALLGGMGASLIELAVARHHLRLAWFMSSTFAVRRLWDYGLPLFLYALALRLYEKLDLFSLKGLGGTAAQAGIYGAALNLSLIPGLFALSFSPLLLATLTRQLHRQEGAAARATARNAMRLILGLLPVAGLIAGAAPELLSWLFGPSFAIGGPVLAFLVFGAVALALISVATVILTAAGKPGWTFALAGPMVPVALGLYLFTIPRWGPPGAALTSAGVAGLGALAAVLAVHRLWGILPPPATLARSVLLGALAYALAAWPVADWLLVLKLSLIGALIPPGYLLLGEFSGNERAAFGTLLRRKPI